MKIKDLKQGIGVQIIAGHWKDRIGTICQFAFGKIIIDIGEPLLISEPPEYLELAPEDPLPPGWEEVEV
ncbi:hypothetical protein [Paenibacillus sp. FSL R10-2734]|uniref:hypothetical protein n=1 Tax=Paenibacillus sp. FSL R10-2734 TaxID=2954691 RepID=UPI0030D7BF78